eukprot:8548517-Alexandrium_andersonii.AAC.1
MSASLVGSEMCIRDSRCASSESAPAWLLESDRKRHPGFPCEWVPQSPHSVSYTHLTLPTICSV